MADFVIGKLGNRWFSAGLVWEPRRRGAWINLLTFTFDVSHGQFPGEPAPSWAVTFDRMRRQP